MPSTRPNVNTASPVKLRFDEKLTGRGLNSDSLQRKLKVSGVHVASGQPAQSSQLLAHLDTKTLLDELSSITEAEPENIDLTSFATVRKDLIGPSLILHKDKGVKAYVACCIAELLNVYAPDAPYTAGELKVRLLHILCPPNTVIKFLGSHILNCSTAPIGHIPVLPQAVGWWSQRPRCTLLSALS
jgi:sister chromatid cohesion protein PDS5